MPQSQSLSFKPRIPSLQHITLYGFIALLVLAPLPFGSNRPWASNLMGLWSAGLLLALAAQIRLQRNFWPEGAPVRQLHIALGLYLVAVFWGWLQTQAWLPSGWHHPVWQSVQGLNANSSPSVTPSQFAESAVRMLCYLGIFLLAFFLGRDPLHAKRILRAIVFAGAVYALYGLIIQATGAKSILFYPKWAYAEFLTSTFVNKNSYATYAGLGLIAAIGLFWNRLKHQPQHASRDFSRASLIIQKFLRKDSIYALLALLIAGALILTSSRAGIFSSIAGCLTFIVMLAINRRWKIMQWLPVMMGCLLFVIILISFSGNFLLERMDYDQIDTDSLMRLNLYHATVMAINARPLLGHGLGSFADMINLYAEQPIQKSFDHAHNDYLEMMLELGIPAALMLFGAIGLVVWRALSGALKRRHMEIFPIMAVAATILVGLHGLFDFSLQIPAVAATYATLLGLGLAQSWSLKNAAD